MKTRKQKLEQMANAPGDTESAVWALLGCHGWDCDTCPAIDLCYMFPGFSHVVAFSKSELAKLKRAKPKRRATLRQRAENYGRAWVMESSREHRSGGFLDGYRAAKKEMRKK